MSEQQDRKTLSQIFKRAVNAVFCSGREKLTRSFAKNCSWRTVAFFDTAAISYFFTGNAVIAGSIATAEIFTASALFMVHEQAWGRVSWGLEKKPAQALKTDQIQTLQDGQQPPDRIITLETKKRSATKTITWRVVASSDTFLLGLLMTGGDVNTATKIAITEIITKIILFYLHERAWNKTQIGVRAPVAGREAEQTEPPKPFF